MPTLFAIHLSTLLAMLAAVLVGVATRQPPRHVGGLSLLSLLPAMAVLANATTQHREILALVALSVMATAWFTAIVHAVTVWLADRRPAVRSRREGCMG